MRRRISAAVGVAAIFLLLSSLGSTALAAGGSGGDLTGRIWVLRTYATGDTYEDVPIGVDANAAFADGRVGGKAGCNTFNGGYTASGADLTFGPLLTTMKACGVPEDAVEQAYLANLARVATYTATTRALVMYDSSGQVLLTFYARSSAGLAKVTWHLRVYNNGNQAVVGVIAGTDPTATFGEDGTVAGNATCNQFFGPFTATTSSVKIGPLGATMMACPTTEQQAQEAAYLAALEASTWYSVQGAELQLRDQTGALQAEFTAVPSEPLPLLPAVLPAAEVTPTPTPEMTVPPTATIPTDRDGSAPIGALLALALAAAVAAAVAIVPARRSRAR